MKLRKIRVKNTFKNLRKLNYQVEVDKVTRLVGNVWAEVATDDAMPCWVVFFVEFFLDVCSDVLRKGKKNIVDNEMKVKQMWLRRK